MDGRLLVKMLLLIIYLGMCIGGALGEGGSLVDGSRYLDNAFNVDLAFVFCGRSDVVHSVLVILRSLTHMYEDV